MDLKGNVSQEQYDAMVKLKGKHPLNPIGSCFDSCGSQFVFFYKDLRVQGFVDPVLCHGEILATAPGQEGKYIIHAWIEAKSGGRDAVLDMIWGEKMHKREFYHKSQPRKVITYTKDQVVENWLRTDSSGPWDPEFLKLQGKLVKERDEQTQTTA